MQENSVVIYLSGSVKKSNKEGNKVFWSERDIHELQDNLRDYRLVILNPNDEFATFDRQAKFGRDLYQVVMSDAVIVDGREKRGIGVGVEMLEAKWRRIPIIGYLPVGSHYRKLNETIKGIHFEEWVHPFMQVLCDDICETISQIASKLKSYVTKEKVPCGHGVVEEAIEYYRENFLKLDVTTKEKIAKVKEDRQ